MGNQWRYFSRFTKNGADGTKVISRQKLSTRLTHWMWAICLFFLLTSGLQIFNAHPTLYWGQQSGFEFDNTVLSIGAKAVDGKRVGYTQIAGIELDTSGVLGLSGTVTDPKIVAFPAWATVPSTQDLATGRVVHFFFAWLFVLTLMAWLIFGVINKHIRKDIIPKGRDFSALGRDIRDHLRFKFTHHVRYSALQKLSYFGVLFLLFPLVILTGLAMSPGMNAAWPWLIEVFGGRQSARTLHFGAMLMLVGFFIIHLLMVIAAGPINEMRSMITGRYRIDRRVLGKSKTNFGDHDAQ